jgi:hypothetical protein
MDAGSEGSEGSSARNASTSAQKASRSSLNSGGALKSKSKPGRRNSNSKQGSSAARWACRLRRGWVCRRAGRRSRRRGF